MFYSQFILAKKGPLGTIWIAAHLERKLRKNQVADTDIGVSVDSILFPEVPIALRLSSHLLLGVVRIYSRKVNYLFDDCSDALLKVKQAFRSTAVDLPPEESKAPYHSITLPETFDLDDFELPDSDIFQGNYVDHHISSREQITLQDTMEGVSYSTSKFGLDERFGDGDVSGLDLDEELFLDKIGTAGQAEQSTDPQASFRSTSPLKQDEHPEDRAANSETMVDGVDEYADLMDYAQAPRTPGLVEEPNLSNVQDAFACDDHLESEYPTVRESENNVPYEDKQEVDWCSQDDKIFDATPQGPHEENGYLSGGLEIKESKPEGESPIETNREKESSLVSGANTDLLGQDETIKPSSEFTDEIIKTTDAPRQGDSPAEAFAEDKTNSLSVDEARDNHVGPNEIGLEINVPEISGSDITVQQVPEGVSANDQALHGVEVPGSMGDTNNQLKSCHDGSESALENQLGSVLETPDAKACQEAADSSALNLDAHDKEAASETLILKPCNSSLEQPDLTNPGCSVSADADVKSNSAAFATHGSEEKTKLGEVHCVTDNSEQSLKENQVQEHASREDIQVAASEPDGQVHNTNSHDRVVENVDNSAEFELPAPEKLLSVPEGHLNQHQDIPVEVSPGDFEGLDEGDTGSKTAAGRKRSFTESTLTEQSLNSVQSSRQVRIKRTAASVPDDDDLLSSILVGRRSSLLKVKPTPPVFEVTSMKRTRSAPRSSAPKRKVLMDDTMVLHGDTIRQQLMNTEDIRRVRKKAPCTLPEISMIQKQHMEDEIFLEAVLTGMSVELASLHGQVYDLSRIRVCQSDVNDAPLEITAEMRLPSQNDENIASLETMVGPNSASHNDKCGASHEIVDELHLTPPNNENHSREDDGGPGKTDIMEESGQEQNNELLIVRDSEIGDAGENHMLNENKLEEADQMSIEVNVSQEQITTNDVGPDDSQKELSLNVAGEETSLTNAGFANAATGGTDDGSAGIIQAASLNETVDPDSCLNMDASGDVPDQNKAELNLGDVNEEQAIARDEVTERDGDVNGAGETEVGARDDVQPDVAQDATAVEVVPNANHEDLEFNVRSEIYDTMCQEQREVECSYPAPISIMEDGSMYNGENPDSLETYQANMMDADVSGFDLLDRDEVDYSAVGNDTDFLNVDDDELTEIADDYLPDAEERQYTENSGWSSRTRAVSKYLQAAFVKEAENGRKSLSMDNLLISKSRKEASRMFFETLVLKTRDYIHAEQRNPFDDITIKPRTRLMKSSF